MIYMSYLQTSMAPQILALRYTVVYHTFDIFTIAAQITLHINTVVAQIAQHMNTRLRLGHTLHTVVVSKHTQ